MNERLEAWSTDLAVGFAVLVFGVTEAMYAVTGTSDRAADGAAGGRRRGDHRPRRASGPPSPSAWSG